MPEYKQLLRPNYNDLPWNERYVDYSMENVEKYYPLEEFTRNIKYNTSGSVSSNYDEICQGYYSIESWERKQEIEIAQKINEEVLRKYQASWKYKFYDMPTMCIEEGVSRVKRAWNVLRGGNDDHYYED